MAETAEAVHVEPRRILRVLTSLVLLVLGMIAAVLVGGMMIWGLRAAVIESGAGGLDGQALRYAFSGVMVGLLLAGVWYALASGMPRRLWRWLMGQRHGFFYGLVSLGLAWVILYA
ncbi:MAG: hypothetical protein KDJ41_09060 [Hyphomicrobiaceae bacterium]|nr:hypothetical protein [Hyphomicrobiaceae bacterium]